jgi:mono/diheme cytochrome c family protein
MKKLLMCLILSVPAAAFAADGKALYEKHCQSCHGPDGKGMESKGKVLKIDPAILNLGRAETANNTRDQQREILLKGKDKMPSYEKKLKADEVDPVLDYALELAKKLRGK